MATPQESPRTFPSWIRGAAFLWLLIWVTAYWRTWGLSNFLHLCDVAVILTCVGLLSSSTLLVSSEAVSSPVVDLMWVLDAGSRLFFGRHVFGGTEYLFDASHPLWIRLLTLFHVGLPILLLWALYRFGYDRRGWLLQSAIALPIFVASRFTSPAQNINFAFTDPFFHRALGTPPLHIGLCWLFMVFVVYLPTHLLLKRFFRRPQGQIS